MDAAPQSSEFPWPAAGLEGEVANLAKDSVRSVVDKYDCMIEALEAARARINDASHEEAAQTLVETDRRVAGLLDGTFADLRRINKQQRSFAKSVDKYIPPKPVPREAKTLVGVKQKIDHAVAMHLVRTGDVTVADGLVGDGDAFFEEQNGKTGTPARETNGHSNTHEPEYEEDDDDDDDDNHDDALVPTQTSKDGLTREKYESLKQEFANMHTLLDEIKNNKIEPAMAWAGAHSRRLRDVGSRLEFELYKLRYLWLYQAWVESEDSDAAAARLDKMIEFARTALMRFDSSYFAEVRRLIGALLFASNMMNSPYVFLTDSATITANVCRQLVHDYCLTLGLTPHPPLMTAITAGAIALPQLVKYTAYMRATKTEWTTSAELAFETPLPQQLVYHPIFVCPILKAQATEKNRPMMLPCGHVICYQSLKELAKKGPQFKCPYCPIESRRDEAIAVTF